MSVQSSWTFETQGDKTKLTLQMVFASADARDQVVKHYNAMEGGKQTLSRLEEYLAQAFGADSELVITRVFDAPRELVFKAWTESELLKHWWGPEGFTWVSGKMDLQIGSVFHYGMRSPDGQEKWGKFVYREIIASMRLIFTNSLQTPKAIRYAPHFRHLAAESIEYVDVHRAGG